MMMSYTSLVIYGFVAILYRLVILAGSWQMILLWWWFTNHFGMKSREEYGRGIFFMVCAFRSLCNKSLAWRTNWSFSNQPKTNGLKDLDIGLTLNNLVETQMAIPYGNINCSENCKRLLYHIKRYQMFKLEFRF